METQYPYNLYDRHPIVKSRTPAVKWFKEWVPQDVVATGGRCFILKWVNEHQLKALREKEKEPPPPEPEPEPEPTTEVLFLCSFEGCGKTFIDAGALRKHSHIHGERQYVCHYEGCGKKFLDSSKLKRHFLIHTGERHFVCPHEGCGKAFSLDFNLKSHMKTHSQENYHICPYPECGKRYAHEYKLKNHVAAHHEKSTPPTIDVPRYATPPEKVPKIPKPSSATYGSAPSQRNFVCPYEGCDKAYLHKYKLNLHLKREHPDHDDNAETATPNADNEMDQGSDQDAYAAKRVNGKTQKRSRPKPNLKLPPAKIAQPKGSKGSSPSPSFVGVAKMPWPVKEGNYEEDSEETEEEDRENAEDRWRYGDNNEDDDDEETEDED